MEISKKETKYLLAVTAAFDKLLYEVPFKVTKEVVTELSRQNMTTLEWEELEKRMKECVNGSN